MKKNIFKVTIIRPFKLCILSSNSENINADEKTKEEDINKHFELLKNQILVSKYNFLYIDFSNVKRIESVYARCTINFFELLKNNSINIFLKINPSYRHIQTQFADYIKNETPPEDIQKYLKSLKK